jgi:hypothetical protein
MRMEGAAAQLTMNEEARYAPTKVAIYLSSISRMWLVL